ncbi:hypothetical protein IAR55_006569 [Kwoniella newhampshirensis]|uniref:Adhesin domain-containing protein n=1 Tax=Kwoniella newhampshirensis TaxID=1651941 RepID=A0AAW0YUD9_9TREE
MPALPTYHLVPADEKRPFDSVSNFERKSEPDVEFDVRKHHPASVGGRRDDPLDSTSYIARTKAGFNGLSKVKKALIVLAVVWFTIAAAHKIAHFVSRDDHHDQKWVKYKMNGVTYARERPRLGAVAAWGCHGTFGQNRLDSITTLYALANVLDGEYRSANATFPASLGREDHYDIKFTGTEGHVVISRADDQTVTEGKHAPVNIVVESTWLGAGEATAEDVQMMTDGRFNSLAISPTTTDINHTVHIVLPAHKRKISSLSISTTFGLKLDIEPSAQDVIIKHMDVKSQAGDITLPPCIGGAIQLKTTYGNITGTFNVSKELTLSTIAGNIDAKINVVPLFPPHRPHPKMGQALDHDDDFGSRQEHDDDDDDDDDEEEHEDNHKDEKKDGKRHHKYDKQYHKHQKKHDQHHKNYENRKSPWSPLSWFISRPPHHPTPDHPPASRSVGIGAYASSGSIKLNVTHQAQFISSEIKAFSHAGDVAVKAADFFQGFYLVGTNYGKFGVSVPESMKRNRVLEEVVTETGGKQKGLVFYEPRKDMTDSTSEAETTVDELIRPPVDYEFGYDQRPEHPPHHPPHRGSTQPRPLPGASEVIAHTDVGNVTVVL